MYYVFFSSDPADEVVECATLEQAKARIAEVVEANYLDLEETDFIVIEGNELKVSVQSKTVVDITVEKPTGIVSMGDYSFSVDATMPASSVSYSIGGQ